MSDWIVTTADMKFPDIPINTEIEILVLENACYMIGDEFKVGDVRKVKAGSVIWYRSSIHAYRLLKEKSFA